jgi:hypothetical protein
MFSLGEIVLVFVAGLTVGMLLERWHQVRHPDDKRNDLR